MKEDGEWIVGLVLLLIGRMTKEKSANVLELQLCLMLAGLGVPP